ncbi:MAG: 30S ribosomal protein S1, partial [Ignavibacteria bacterium]|nr:30S ribosomal protein S1 [Ignavibacteria bacterium]
MTNELETSQLDSEISNDEDNKTVENEIATKETKNSNEEKSKVPKFINPDYDDEEFQTMLKLYEKTFNVIKENELVKGKIVAIHGEDVLIDIGSKSDGRVSINEFSNQEELVVGNEIEIFLEKIEDKEGQLILSKKKADSIKMWDNIVEAQKNSTIVQGKCIRRIKGGFVVDLNGLTAFLPGSQIDTKPIRDYDEYVGKTLDFKVIKINNQIENIIVSHKILIEESMAGQREELLRTIKKGITLDANVKAITDFGVFVDLGGLDGLIHITDLSWGRINHPSDVVKLDQKIRVYVIEFDEEKQRVYLGLKQLQPHPWDNIEEKFNIGDKVSGKVVSLTEYGAFIEIEKGIEGLIHISEMSWTQHITNPSQMVTMGQVVEAQILNIDLENRKLSLGMKQLTPNPWQSLLERFPVGTKQKGKVCNITNFGVFVELEEGVDGLVHISDLSWTKKILDVNDFIKMGDDLEVVILGVDVANQRISLGHKQLFDNPWDKLEEKYKMGFETECKVIKPIEKGIIVELPDLVDSFIPASQLAVAPIRNFGEHFNFGDTLKTELIEFDKSNKKIVLSVIEYFKDKDQSEIDEYIAKYKLPRKFTANDIKEKTRSFESEQIDFKLEDIIGEDVPLANKPPAIKTFEKKSAETDIKPITEKIEEPADTEIKEPVDEKKVDEKVEVKSEEKNVDEKTEVKDINETLEKTEETVKVEPEKKEDEPIEKKEDEPIEKKEDEPIEKKEDEPIEKKEDEPIEKKED